MDPRLRMSHGGGILLYNICPWDLKSIYLDDVVGIFYSKICFGLILYIKNIYIGLVINKIINQEKFTKRICNLFKNIKCYKGQGTMHEIIVVV